MLGLNFQISQMMIKISTTLNLFQGVDLSGFCSTERPVSETAFGFPVQLSLKVLHLLPEVEGIPSLLYDMRKTCLSIQKTKYAIVWTVISLIMQMPSVIVCMLYIIAMYCMYVYMLAGYIEYCVCVCHF